MRLLPLLALLVACTDGDKPTTDTAAVTDTVVDADGDGFDTSEDCDDNNSLVSPSAVELCDGFDNNCDGQIDEGVTTTYYTDDDGDGFGDPAQPTESCEQPPGTVPNGNDCDDTSDLAFPGGIEVCDGLDNNCDGTIDEGVGATYYADGDQDGYGDPATAEPACEQPVGTVEDATDCDDTDASSYPGGTEVCDEADNNCDGTVDEGVTTTWYADSDSDSFGSPSETTEACVLPTGYAAEPGDCDDTNKAINPDAAELCDKVDNDCDGDVDEDDADDAQTWHQDGDGDAYGDPKVSTVACYQPSGYVSDSTDCDDTDADTNAGADEFCDGHDDDCDGTVDEDDAVDASTWYEDGDGDAYGDPKSSDVACDQPTGYVSDSTDCDDGSSSTYPGADEYCDGHDDDCDGDTDEDDAVDASDWYADSDGDSYGDAGSVDTACSQPSGYLSDSTDCNDGDNQIYPGADEYCDKVDNDCDGDIDEDDALDADYWYADDDGDSYGDPDDEETACSQPSGTVADDTDCDDSRSASNPGADEYCNGYDDDCDGTIDEDDAVDAETWHLDDDGDGYGTSSTLVACDEPSGYTAASGDCDDSDSGSNPGAAEVCDGEDNDCDGTEDNGVLGTGTSCPAEDCTEILADDSSASDGYYELDAGNYYCDMTTDGGGWTLVKDAAKVYGTGYSTSYYNSEGFTWDEALFAYNSGSVHAHCTYPGSMTGCNNLGFQFGSENWGVAKNWGSSLCGMSTKSYTSATSYIGGYDFVISRTSSTDTIRLGTLEGIAACTTSDNPGTAYTDIYVRH